MTSCTICISRNSRFFLLGITVDFSHLSVIITLDSMIYKRMQQIKMSVNIRLLLIARIADPRRVFLNIHLINYMWPDIKST